MNILSAENTYGINKRFSFVEKTIIRINPATLLDVGCGAGTYLTFPIAKRFPAVRVVGVDSDYPSISFAQRNYPLSNLEFKLFDILGEHEKFDLIIASEVIEHVEDPLKFLVNLKSRLNPGGVLIVTLPNGYGPFEIMEFIETLLDITAIPKLLRRLGGRSKNSLNTLTDTLAVSPHVNFFSFSQIQSLFGVVGFRVNEYLPRTLLCGWGFDYILRNNWLIAWNAKVSEFMPAIFCSDWMFVLDQTEPLPYRSYCRNLYGRLRRFLNARQLANRGPAN
jgi:SAM-dependent methyltransferase